MGQMASGLAHELNQPLGAILNYAGVGLAQAKSSNGASTKLVAALQEIMSETRRAGEIISRMREFVRKQQPNAQPIDLSHLVTQSLRLLQFELRRHEVRTKLELASGLPPVMADAIQIEQVLVNLISNAMEAMDGQEPQSRLLEIRTTLWRDSKQAAVIVSDSGAGISPADAARLFDAFFTTKPNGLGMGLNISRSIIECHGGRLTASANAQRGMRFSFTLPVESEVRDE